MSVAWSEAEAAFVVSRYALVAACLRDPRLSSVVPPRSLDRAPAGVADLYLAVLRRQLDLMDGTAHDEGRRAAGASIDPDSVAAATAQWLDEHVRGLPPAFDLISAVAQPLARLVTHTIVGTPPPERAQLDRLAGLFVSALDRPAESAAQAEAALAAIRHVIDTSAGLAPARTLLGSSPSKLATDDRLASTILFTAAGQPTLSQSIASGAWLLLQHPQALQTLRDEPAVWATAIEEMLRLESAVPRVRRRALEPVTLGEVALPAGADVVLLLGTANRDPMEFPEPERFDVRRTPNRHLAFGAGPHVCLGAPLARIAARTALQAVCALPNLRVVDVSWHEAAAARRLTRLTLAWS